MFRYTTGFLVIFAACFGAQTVALRLSGGKTLKSESNYFSSVARIQTETQGKPRIMMLGSSMTGRLGDRARHIEGVANLGCDGGSAMVALRAMDENILPPAPTLVIEANTLSYELEHRGKEIGKAIASPWFQVGIRHSNLSATARPAAFAYSWLMTRKVESNASSEFLPIASKPAVLDPTTAPLLDANADTLVDEITAMLKRMEKRGCKILIVMLPPALDANSTQSKIAHAVAARSGIAWWDLTDGLPPGSVGFSDGLHLDAPSAQKVMLTLMRELDTP